ncbi:radical SAM protein [Coriobacteriales bacterium OH1046]|nr:radical SAM protein [Coriobacteriales bacterium OH1046]
MTVQINEVEAKGIMTASNLPVADFSVNPYVGCAFACTYCYASFMKRFTNHREPWGDFVDVKFWPPIKHPEKHAGKEAFLGSVCDPYQPAEKTYGRTRALLEELAGSGISISIATKSDLVLRDLDLIKTFPNARVSWSINTLDEDVRRAMDKAVPIRRKLDAMRRFYEAGVRTTCFISPIMPGITDCKEIILEAKDICNLVWLENLNLRGDYKPRILNWIHATHPGLDGLYEGIYQHRDRTYWSGLDDEMRAFCAEQGMPYVRDDDSQYAEFGNPPVVVNYFFHEELIPSAKKRAAHA